MPEADARAAFRRLLRLPEDELDLAEAALWVAAEEYPALRPSAYLEWLARTAGELKQRLRRETGPQRIVEIVNRFLFAELHFQGNRQEYYDPRNSYLNEVIDRRLGIPISLAVLYLALGERAGLPVRGVGLPGHFLVKYAPAAADAEIFIDPFNTRTLDRHGCAQLLDEVYQGSVPMRPAFLEPTLKRQILARMLNNLKSIYVSRGDLLRALAASDRIVLADPHLTSEWRDRGVILYRLHRDRDALADFERYLALAPEPEDAGRVRQLKKELLARLN